MDRVTLQNYRCFREKQSARLAPLTFLVGENSTGKTSFLALLRALWQVAFQDRIPDFRQPPYDLGSFEDVVHYRGANNKRPDSFDVYFECASPPIYDVRVSYHVIFDDSDGYPFPSTRKLSRESSWLEVNQKDDADTIIRFGSHSKQYEHIEKGIGRRVSERLLSPFRYAIRDASFAVQEEINRETSQDEILSDSLSAKKTTIEKVEDDFYYFMSYLYKAMGILPIDSTPFASAPIRSHPKRTYDPSRPTPDPEGEYIPDYLASMSRNAPEQWEWLKSNLEAFGKDSGLFDEIAVRSFGKTSGSPFQIQIRKFGKRLKGPKRNLIDVGYGVSQALPILAELLREDSPKMFLLQQPEVHLHPRAQAALGSLFCNLAASGKQIIVETHSDYILDRVYMDIRDKRTDLKAEDVSILYFERDELDVNIHSIKIDEDGNVLDAPLGYRQFFMEEMRRSIGL